MNLMSNYRSKPVKNNRLQVQTAHPKVGVVLKCMRKVTEM